MSSGQNKIYSAHWSRIFAFSFNNSATNVYYMFTIMYFTLFATGYLGWKGLILAVTPLVLRLFDAFSDPIVGILIDNNSGKFGKFRPFMIGGQIILAITFLLMLNVIQTDWPFWLQAIVFIVLNIIHLIGYSMQTASTKGGQTTITNNPKQRPLLMVFITIITLLLFVIIPIVITNLIKTYDNSAELWRSFSFIVVGIGILCTLFAVWGISPNDRKEFYDANFKSDKIKYRDVFALLKSNRALQMLIIAASSDKLATVASGGVGIYLFSNVLLNQELNATMSVISLPFILIATFAGYMISRKYDLKKSFVINSAISLVIFVVMAILMPEVGADRSSTMVIIFLAFNVGSRAIVNLTGNLVIPMIADVTDYEYYQTKRFAPGLIGTTFSFVDKVISSLGGFIIGVMFTIFSVEQDTIKIDEPGTTGLWVTILVCMMILPALGNLCSIIAMKFYPIDREMLAKMHDLEGNKSV